MALPEESIFAIENKQFFQGIIIYTMNNNFSFSVIISPSKIERKPYIALRVNEGHVKFVFQTKDDVQKVLHEVDKFDVGIHKLTYTYDSFWFSYDRDGCCLKYGKGYFMEQTTLMTCNIKDTDLTPSEIDQFFGVGNQLYVSISYTPLVGADPTMIELEPRVHFRPTPFIMNYSPIVLDSSEVSMFNLDRADCMFSSSLPEACREVYDNIKNLNLNDPYDPIMKLTDAIRYSMYQPGCLLYTTLENKKGEFGQVNMVYLRVTLGPNRRTAPGIPYVLEIWPKGNCSPIHNHSGACAVIKVLHGRININIFNKLTNPAPTDPEVLLTYDAKEGDTTWLSRYWFQTHQLKNNTTDFCATIQCYRYEEGDTLNYPDFDYINPLKDGADLEKFLPNSDITFLEMRQKVLEEYSDYLKGKIPKTLKKTP